MPFALEAWNENASSTTVQVRGHELRSLKKRTEILLRLICCVRKTLFQLKKQNEKDGL